MDKIRLLILIVGIIVIISFSIYSFKGTTPSSQPEGTKIKPIGQITIIPSPNKNLNSYSVKNTSTSDLKSHELTPLYHYISFGTNPVGTAVESASSAPS